MPQSPVTTILTEGPSALVIRVTLTSDGSGELLRFPILYPSDLNPPQSNTKPQFRVMELWYGLVWFDVIIGTNLLQPQILWTSARDCDSHVDFRYFGGLQEMPGAVTQPPPVSDGVLWISTNNFAPVGSTGSLVLSLIKANRP